MGMFPGVKVPAGWNDRLPTINRRVGSGGSAALADGLREQPATLRILNARPGSALPISLSGADRKLAEAVLKEMGGATSNGMASFLVQTVTYQDSDKVMVMPTFGDDFAIYFMGRSPRRISVQGVLIDDYFNNWFYKFLKVYDMLLRGTRLARYFRLLQLNLHNATMTGVITGISYSQNASNDTQVSFAFDMILKSYEPISSPGVNLDDQIASWNSINSKMEMYRMLAGKTLSAIPTALTEEAMALLFDTSRATEVSRVTAAFWESEQWKAQMLNADSILRELDAEELAGKFQPAKKKKSLLSSLSDGVKSIKGVVGDLQKSLRDVSGFIKGWQTKIKSVVDPLTKSIQDFKDSVKQIQKVRGDVISFAKNARKLIKAEGKILRSGKLGAITSGTSLQNIRDIVDMADKVPLLGSKGQGNVLNGLSKANSGLDNLTQFGTGVRTFRQNQPSLSNIGGVFK